jgi:hypothetical protein
MKRLCKSLGIHDNTLNPKWRNQMDHIQPLIFGHEKHAYYSLIQRSQKLVNIGEILATDIPDIHWWPWKVIDLVESTLKSIFRTPSLG